LKWWNFEIKFKYEIKEKYRLSYRKTRTKGPTDTFTSGYNISIKGSFELGMLLNLSLISF